jgi:hypothetical protein
MMTARIVHLDRAAMHGIADRRARATESGIFAKLGKC